MAKLVLLTCHEIARVCVNLELCTQFEVRPRDVGRYYKRILKLKKDGKVKLTKKKRPGKEDLPRSARFLVRFTFIVMFPTSCGAGVTRYHHAGVDALRRPPVVMPRIRYQRS